MDPNATYLIMMDETLDLDSRAVAATDLLVWAAWRGDWDTILVAASKTMNEIAEECRHRIFKALDALAATEGVPA